MTKKKKTPHQGGGLRRCVLTQTLFRDGFVAQPRYLYAVLMQSLHAFICRVFPKYPFIVAISL